jgi:ribosome-binding factor A
MTAAIVGKDYLHRKVFFTYLHRDKAAMVELVAALCCATHSHKSVLQDAAHHPHKSVLQDFTLDEPKP